MARPAMDGLRLMLVEDEYLQAMYLSEAFTHSGASIVGMAACVDQALELIATTGPIDAAVLDVSLRDEMSFPIADALAARGIPFVFTSGYDREVLPERYQDAAMCNKPVSPADVLDALAHSSPAPVDNEATQENRLH